MIDESEGKGIVGDVSIQNVACSNGNNLPATTQITSGHITALLGSLTRTSDDLHETCEAIEWEGVKLLRKIVGRRKSCVIVGEDGSGKGSAAGLLEEDQDVHVLYCPHDVSDLYKDIWYILGQPIPDVCSFLKTDRSQGKIRFYCRGCHRLCSLCEIIDRGFFLRPERDDILLGICQVTGYCKMVAKIVQDNLDSVANNIFVMRLPDVEDKTITLLNQLLDRSRLIILANPDQHRALKKLNRFRKLPVHSFPKPDPQFFIKLVQGNAESASVPAYPLVPDAMVLIAYLSRFNPGRYAEMLCQILDYMELEGQTDTVDVTYVLKVLALAMDEDAMILVSLSHFKGWVKARAIAEYIRWTFGYEITTERLGGKLSRWGILQRNNNGSEYNLSSPALCMTEGTKGTKGKVSITQLKEPENSNKSIIDNNGKGNYWKKYLLT